MYFMTSARLIEDSHLGWGTTSAVTTDSITHLGFDARFDVFWHSKHTL